MPTAFLTSLNVACSNSCSAMKHVDKSTHVRRLLPARHEAGGNPPGPRPNLRLRTRGRKRCTRHNGEAARCSTGFDPISRAFPHHEIISWKAGLVAVSCSKGVRASAVVACTWWCKSGANWVWWRRAARGSPRPTHHPPSTRRNSRQAELSATTADPAVLTGPTSADAMVAVLMVPSVAPRDQRGDR